MIIQLLSRYKKSLPFVAGLVAALLIILPTHRALALTCPYYPDYTQAGTHDISDASCPTNPTYTLVADPDPSDTNSVIQYAVTNADGTVDNITTLYLQNPKADPLVWQGTGIDNGDTIDVAINKSDVSGGTILAYRSDNGATPPTGISVTADQTVLQDFAQTEGITVNNVASTDKPCSGGNFLGFPTWYAYLPGQQTTNSDGVTSCSPELNSLSDIWLIVAAVVEILLRIAALVAIVIIIWGGVDFITSQGEPDKAAKARSQVVNAVIGLAIAVTAAAIVTYIAGKFTS